MHVDSYAHEVRQQLTHMSVSYFILGIRYFKFGAKEITTGLGDYGSNTRLLVLQKWQSLDRLT